MPGKDAIALLTADHRKVQGLFTRYEGLGKRALRSRETLAEQIGRELSVHAAIEEEVLYPALRRLLPAEEDGVLEALEEHHLVKTSLLELASLSPQSERFHPKMTVLMEEVRHHIEEEEGEMFPRLREAVPAEELVRLGAALERARASAPTRPHPHAPDAPPGNLVAGALSAPLDAVGGAGRWLLKRARGAPATWGRTVRLARLGWHVGRHELGRRLPARGGRRG